MKNTKTQSTETMREIFYEMDEFFLNTQKIENKDIKSFNQLPTYILDTIKELNNTYRKPKLKYGGEVVNTIMYVVK